MKGRYRPAVAVILSGVDADGAAALRAFARSGGVVIAQAPDTAERAGMPLAAILTGAVDHVLPPEAIAEQLERIAREFNESSGADDTSQGGELQTDKNLRDPRAQNGRSRGGNVS